MKTIITKQQLIDWATNLKTDEVAFDVEWWGGGKSTTGRTVVSYDFCVAVVEEFANDEHSAIHKLTHEEQDAEDTKEEARQEGGAATKEEVEGSAQ